MKSLQNTVETGESSRDLGPGDNGRGLSDRSVGARTAALPLIEKLCQMLEAEGITYCHWKSNNAIDLSASGDNDLDLLVSRAHAERFVEILAHLGFKPAEAPKRRKMPAVIDYFGYDQRADSLVHVHAHYQLVLGHDMTKNYRLPIENPFLESAVQGDLFKVPAPEFEFIVFVIRMVLKHSTWDVILGMQGTLKEAESQELAWLEAHIDRERVYELVQRHLPYITVDLFKACLRAIRPGCSLWSRVRTGHRLQAGLQANARRSMAADIYLKFWRRARLVVRRRLLKSSAAKYRLNSGGTVIAIIGGDGAGKSTTVDALYSWLSTYFEVTSVHMGKPDWSRTTLLARGILKIGNWLGLYPVETSMRETLRQKSLISPGYPWLIREVCRARDRYWTYVWARRFAANGGAVILDRFPLPQVRLMDGPRSEQFIDGLTDSPQAAQFLKPQAGGRLATALARMEKNYYRAIVSPEVVVVLRLDPEIAVQRRSDEEPAFVRQRNTEIWELDWADADVHLVDGSKAKEDIQAEIKSLVWSEL